MGGCYVRYCFCQRSAACPYNLPCTPLEWCERSRWTAEWCRALQRALAGKAAVGLGCGQIKRRENGGFLLSKKISRGGVRWQSKCLGGGKKKRGGQEENWRWSGTKGGWPRMHSLATCCLILPCAALAASCFQYSWTSTLHAGSGGLNFQRCVSAECVQTLCYSKQPPALCFYLHVYVRP